MTLQLTHIETRPQITCFQNSLYLKSPEVFGDECTPTKLKISDVFKKANSDQRVEQLAQQNLLIRNIKHHTLSDLNSSPTDLQQILEKTQIDTMSRGIIYAKQALRIDHLMRYLSLLVKHPNLTLETSQESIFLLRPDNGWTHIAYSDNTEFDIAFFPFAKDNGYFNIYGIKHLETTHQTTNGIVAISTKGYCLCCVKKPTTLPSSDVSVSKFLPELIKASFGNQNELHKLRIGTIYIHKSIQLPLSFKPQAGRQLAIFPLSGSDTTIETVGLTHNIKGNADTMASYSFQGGDACINVISGTVMIYLPPSSL